jgi:VWFA-related protein
VSKQLMSPMTRLPIAAMACAAASGLLLASSPQRPTFSSGVEAVRVDVLVTDHGRPVPGLRPSDFELKDNGVVQRIDIVDTAETPLNVVLVFDTSESTAGQPLEQLRAAGRALLDDLDPRDRAALIGFDDSVQLRARLSADRTRVRAALDEAAPGGGTALVDAAFGGVTVAESEAGRSLAIVFSDGIDTSSWLAPETAVDLARRGAVVVYGVTASAARKARFLRDLAEATAGRVMEVESSADLGATFLQILREFRQRYVIAFSPRGVGGAGWHSLDVRLTSRRGTVTARRGYFVKAPPAR